MVDSPTPAMMGSVQDGSWQALGSQELQGCHALGGLESGLVLEQLGLCLCQPLLLSRFFLNGYKWINYPFVW